MGLQAKIVYLFTTEPLSDATIKRLGADMLANLPDGTPIPDHCQTIPIQIAGGASISQLERILGAKGRDAVRCTKSFCIATRGDDENVSEGFFVGF